MIYIVSFLCLASLEECKCGDVFVVLFVDDLVLCTRQDIDKLSDDDRSIKRDSESLAVSINPPSTSYSSVCIECTQDDYSLFSWFRQDSVFILFITLCYNLYELFIYTCLSQTKLLYIETC